MCLSRGTVQLQYLRRVTNHQDTITEDEQTTDFNIVDICKRN